MAANRLTQETAEIAALQNPNARLTQVAAEIDATSVPNARLTQVAAEIDVSYTTALPAARLTQLAVEVLVVIYEGPQPSLTPGNSVGEVVTLPVFPLQTPGVVLSGNLVRGASYTVLETPNFSTEQQQAKSGRVYRVPDWKNPLYQWTFTWNYIKDNPSDILAANSPYTDFQIIKGFYLLMGGKGGNFAYVPKDSVQISTVIPPPNVTALTQTAGGALAATTYFVRLTYSNGGVETTWGTEGSLAVSANNVLNVASPPASTGATGWNVYVSNTAGGGSGHETKQNGSPIAIGTPWVEPTSGLVVGAAPPSQNLAGTTGGIQTLAAPDANNYTELTINRGGQFFESIQELNGTIPAIFANGVGKTQGVDYNLLSPASTPPYQGFVIQWLTTPTQPITANYTYFYRCQFADDSEDFEWFMLNLYTLKKCVIRQVRL